MCEKIKLKKSVVSEIYDKEMSWVCYLLRCTDDTLYCGITNDLDKRIKAHNSGKASRYTRTRLPVELVFAEYCAGRSAASKREIEIKSQAREKKLALIQSGVIHARRSGAG